MYKYTVQYTENTVYVHNYNKKTCKRKDILFYNRNWTWEQEGRRYNMLYTHSSTTCILYTTKKEGVIYTIHYTKYISFPFPPGSFPLNVICPPASPKYKITLLVSWCSILASCGLFQKSPYRLLRPRFQVRIRHSEIL